MKLMKKTPSVDRTQEPLAAVVERVELLVFLLLLFVRNMKIL